ncbi:MAG: porphyrin biosynthesis protein [Burkholderiales bacterium RIFCSPLOWO2_12_FULL_64_99]|uniref:heme biosynthesis HemY N-terminal domain-containing protein n=1 Tax=Aquabacterium sp. TaxID=1872578 RepID=UPI0008C28910|nr:heme biosynthesis HemY N-terminal domain-containing protein [Aquabacterium sp.]OGB02843.1 MAG: porphyrin biosynthesis protein [Burkholderiales bacterium RIFCSPHIGHO2_12_FULL_63_20]OGB64446.1 MAG: porphyrin biosynthesis protein [Burkholderiales bacterium RIFCSPLOWO2_12_FULL_64_99]
MRSIVWLLLVAVIAVVGATALGANDGLVTIYWRGWRTDFSLNLFLLVMVALFMAVYSLVRALDSLLALPERAKQWRTSRRDRVAQAALREGLALYLAGRYTRAHKTCQKAIAIQADTPELALDAEFTALAHMLSAGSLHRLQDRTRRDEHLQRALEMARLTRKPRATEEGARLMSAESALEDRDAARALRELSELPPGVARRTQALRLKLQAARLARQPMEALRTARLLAKHQGFTPSAAEGLLRTLASETLDGARDADQMRALWVNLDMQDKRDPLLVASAARRMADLGAPQEARQWLAPLWDQLNKQSPEAIDALAAALRESLSGLEAEWLPRLDATTPAALRNPALALTLGLALAERQLWGKARGMLLSAANDLQLNVNDRRTAWAQLGLMAEREGRPEEAARFYRLAALPERD